MTPLHAKLICELTDLDRRNLQKKVGYNMYALSHYMHAARAAADEITEGSTPEVAFSRNFTPCREMHRIARRLGLNLDVERGQWVLSRGND